MYNERNAPFMCATCFYTSEMHSVHLGRTWPHKPTAKNPVLISELFPQHVLDRKSDVQLNIIDKTLVRLEEGLLNEIC